MMHTTVYTCKQIRSEYECNALNYTLSVYSETTIKKMLNVTQCINTVILDA